MGVIDQEVWAKAYEMYMRCIIDRGIDDQLKAGRDLPLYDGTYCSFDHLKYRRMSVKAIYTMMLFEKVSAGLLSG